MATMISNLGATGIVTVNYGTGSPQEAAALIAYLNASTTSTASIGVGEEWEGASQSWQNVDWKTAGYWASIRAATPLKVDDGLNFLRIGRSAPFNLHYIEIGNEVYGSWETDEHGTGGDTGAPHDPTTYVKFAKQVQTLSASFAPSISIGIDADETFSSTWVASVLQQSVVQGFTVGWISDHNYMQEPGSESDSTLLEGTSSNSSSGTDWSNRAAVYHMLLQQKLGNTAASQVQLLATEYNSVSYNPGKQTTSLVDGLFFADALGSLLQAGYAAGVSWDLHNSYETGNNNSASLYGWRNGGDYGLLGSANDNDAPASAPNVPYPTYFAEQLVSKFEHAGDTVVSVASNDPNLTVYGVREANGHLTLLAINKSSTAALTGQFQISGFQPATQATVWQYGETQDTAQSQTTDGHSALANSTATLTVAGSNFSYQFPQYSMTVLDLTPNPQTTVYVSSTNFGLASAPTIGQNIADADQGTAGSQAAVFGVNAFATIAAAQLAVSSSGTIVVNAGTYPESPSVTGTQNFRISGNVTVNSLTLSPGTLALDLVSKTVYDSVSAASVNLSGTTLSINAGMTINNGDSFTLLAVAGTNRITGAFNGLAEGGTFTVGTQMFRISYAGGDGNDVVLTATGPTTLVGSPTLNGGMAYITNTNASKQHSMVESVVYSFSAGVSLSAANFTLSGISGTTLVPTVNVASSSGGSVWTVTFAGAGVNAATHSIGDGEYSLVLSGVPGLANNTYDFFRLLGDMDGSGTVDTTDFATLVSTLLRSTDDPLYLGADDLDGDGTIGTTDFTQFAGNFLKSLPTPLPN